MVRRGKLRLPLSALPVEIVVYVLARPWAISISSFGLRTPNFADTAAKSVPLLACTMFASWQVLSISVRSTTMPRWSVYPLRYTGLTGKISSTLRPGPATT